MVTLQDFVRRHKSQSHLTLQNSIKHSGSEFRVKQQWQNSYREVTSPLHMKQQVLKFRLGTYTLMFFYLTILVAFYMYQFANMVSTILKRYWICLESGLPGQIQGEGAGGAHPPPPHEMTCGFLIRLVFCKKKNYVVYWC